MKHIAEKNTTMTLIVLLSINILLLLYIGFFKKDAVRLETVKVGGAENFTLVQQLYNSDMYKTQQTQAIQQVLDSMNQVAQPEMIVAPEELEVPAE
jgi:hypothetical protein